MVEREQVWLDYLEQLPYEPYPVQDDAITAWFEGEEGVLVCAPTGTGKTLIAEAALFEALKTGKKAYFTTPLIALTDQKFTEFQESAERWGFGADQIGLVTGNRRVNPEAPILVVVAEILLNRLLSGEYDFSDVSGVVMDEFHSFNDAERGIVWELSLGMLPKTTRVLLLSATVGNAPDFVVWLKKAHNRTLRLVQSEDRKVPLSFFWIEDQLLNEHLEWMTAGEDQAKKTPALVFCFNRNECWTVADQLKGRSLVSSDQQKQIEQIVSEYDWSTGAGPKLKQILLRGVGIHHAGILPKYKRVVESLFQQKLLSVCVCTETLAAGINLPARSVVMTSLLKGPVTKQKLIESSTAKQIFGRAGRPQFDDQGFVYSLAHEDDVKIFRWKEKYDQIPEDTKDPMLIRAKKQLKKKMPTRNSKRQYWNEDQFVKLQQSPSSALMSQAHLPWRVLAHLLLANPQVDPIREFISKRLYQGKAIQTAEKQLHRALHTLWEGGFVKLDPEPVMEKPEPKQETDESKQEESQPAEENSFGIGLGDLLQQAIKGEEKEPEKQKKEGKSKAPAPREIIWPTSATPTPLLDELFEFRSCHPIYGCFLKRILVNADRNERIQAMESVLELSGSVAKHVRVPGHERIPPGKLATEFLHQKLLSEGLATAQQLFGTPPDEEEPHERPQPPLSFAEQLGVLFRSEQPTVHDLRLSPVWCVGDVLEFDGDFNKFISGRKLARQEGLLFRHLLRMILLSAEFEAVLPQTEQYEEFAHDLHDIKSILSETCHRIDPASTEETIEAISHQKAEAGS